MTEKVLPIGIDSEVEHVQSEIDRIDGIFTVATGPMGHQEVNYHIIDQDERDQRVIQPSLSHRESKKEEPSLKSQSSSAQDKRSNNDFHSKAVFELSEDQKSNISIQPVIYDDDEDRKDRFSLPEIEGTSNQPENSDQSKQVVNLFKPSGKKQSDFHVTKNIDKDDSSSDVSFLNDSTLDVPEHCRPIVNDTLQRQAESLVPFYTFNELAQHNDSWICIFGHIYDITSLLEQIQGTPLHQLLIDSAGQDISSWFDEQTREPRRRIDPHTHQSVLLIKNLSILDALGTPFWQTNDLFIGHLTEQARYIRLKYTFSPRQSFLLEVAEEETIGQIAQKFSKYNSHIFSYLWRYNGQTLDYQKTLTENGVPNEESFHDQYGWRSENENCPTILLRFCDDLTIA